MPASNDHPRQGFYPALEFAVGQHSLFVAALGQSMFYVHLFKPYLPVWAAVPFLLLPWITVFMIFFTNRPLFPPLQTRYYWLYAAFACNALTVIAEIIWLLGYMPALMPKPPVTPAEATVLIQVAMNLGWLSLVPLLHDYFRNRPLWS
jgi:hypothetical protein